MRYMRTQIYLDPADHRMLTEEAQQRGISLTALIREIVRQFTVERRPTRPRGVESLIGFAQGEPTDIAREERSYREAALDGRRRKKLGEPAG
ncbi:MAG: CopG family transcriptional regulator [Actinomycetota bacterium]